MFVVDCQGQGGGLAMLWRNKDDLTVQSYSNNHVDAIVNVQGWNQFRLTGLYGEPDRSKRQSTWNLIRLLSSQNQTPWCLIGDMNNVLGQDDKRGGRLYPTWLIQGFQEVMDECGLQDMELQGYPFTWQRGHGTSKWVEIRLDMALVSKAWTDIFGDAKLINLEVTTSDHCPILLEPTPVSTIPRRRRIKFENAWLREPVCRKIVEDSWLLHQKDALQTRISKCLEDVSAWGLDFTGNFRERIHRCKKVIINTKGSRDLEAVQRHQKANQELSEILTQQEVFWKQRFKQLWLKEGDKNSNFFYATAKARRKNN